MKFKRQRIVWNAKKAERVKEDDDKAHNWCGNGKQMSRIFRGYNRKRANQWWGHYTHSFFIFYFFLKKEYFVVSTARHQFPFVPTFIIRLCIGAKLVHFKLTWLDFIKYQPAFYMQLISIVFLYTYIIFIDVKFHENLIICSRPHWHQLLQYFYFFCAPYTIRFTSIRHHQVSVRDIFFFLLMINQI